MKCILNINSRIEITSSHITNLDLGWTSDVLKINKEYNVYGLGLHTSGAKILIDPSDCGDPAWYDSNVFLIVCQNISKTWKCVQFDQNTDDWGIVFGYEELLNDSDHFNGILEGDEKSLDIFLHRKRIIDMEA